jgi:asparagine synthase (glutamine-hydrolysing)
MCGIAGYIGPTPPDEAAARRTLAAMAHRGPDGDGMWRGAIGAASVLLLHTRLAIIDPDPRSAQPFARDGVVLVYNGEIYNYLEIRADLVARGHRFDTESDTEVLLRAYLEWGEDCLDRLEGMWAFALVDTRDATVLLSRDRFGEKPLFTLEADGGIYFASEVKQVAALSGRRFAVDLDKTHTFLAHGYRAVFRDDRCFFVGPRAFPPAAVAKVAGTGMEAPRPYWRPGHAPVEMSLGDAVEGARAAIDRAIRIRLRADVPIAVSLSGGIDSNIVAGLAVHRHGQSLHAFSMLEEDRDYDESAAIRRAAEALGVPRHETRVSSAGFLDRLAAMTRAYDGPVPSLGMYLDGFLCEAVAEAGYKVLICGNGADEIFLGYYDQYLFWLAGRAAEDPDGFDDLVEDWRRSLGAHVRNPLLKNPRAFLDAPEERGHVALNAPDVADYLRHPVSASFPEARFTDDLVRNRMLNELTRESVPVLTWAHDAHYMARSIENRAAYLDRGLVDFMASVPSRHLIHDGYTKYLLREAGAGVVPEDILRLKKKHGFNAPIASLLDRDDPETRARLLADSAFWDLVDRDAAARLLDPATETRGLDNFLFCLVSARLFFETAVD